jgi:hypothetical protein
MMSGLFVLLGLMIFCRLFELVGRSFVMVSGSSIMLVSL